MIRSNKSKTKVHEPVYRHVLRQAWHIAWHDKKYWVLAFFSSFLLSAGSYDIFGSMYMRILNQAEFLSGARDGIQRVSLNGFGGIMNMLTAFEWLIIACVLIAALLAFSCIAQGALVYSIGAAHKGEKSPIKKALGIGARAFWPIATLNVLALLAFAVAKFLIAAFLNIALADGGMIMGLVYVGIFVLLMAALFAVTIVQIFALNAMILQGASVADAIIRGYQLFIRNWVVAVETALILAIISILFNVLLAYTLFIGALPFLLAIITASVMQAQFVFWSVVILAGIGLLAVFLAAVSFLSQLQYATWTLLYRKLGEGGVLPKLHRIARNVFGVFSVPNN